MLIGALFGLAAIAVGVQAAFSATTVAPPTVTSHPAAVTSSTSATFTFAGPAGATFRCALDSTTFTTCTTPKIYNGAAEGSHTFRVKSVVTGKESTATTYAWRVDTLPPPPPSLAAKPAVLSNTTSPSFSFTDSESAVAYRCALDGSTYVACSSPRGYSNLAQGTHSFIVQAVDAGGNRSSATAWSWTIDSIAPPAPVLTTKPSDPTYTATNTFAWTDAESGVRFQCAKENGFWAGCSSPYTWVIKTTNYGQHQFSVRAVDSAGNVAATSYTFKYEKGLPTTGLPFGISGSASAMSIGVWKPLAVTISNPNSVTIHVSALTVAVAADSNPSGCASATNIELQQSNVSTSLTVSVPANGSLVLPAQGATAPQIRLKNLPTVNQDVCKSKSFALSYSGTATN
jgi:hypothetical protein